MATALRHPMHVAPPLRWTLAAAVGLAGAQAVAQTAPAQIVRPPQAQAWIDVATFSGLAMPAAGGNPMGAVLGGLFGGGGADGNSFGRTVAGSAGRWVDITVASRANPGLSEAQQAVPAGLLPSPLKLQAPPARGGTVPDLERDEVDPTVERPRGRLLLYWGCGTVVRAGQPKVLDMASASAADIGRFFVSRHAGRRGAHEAPGRPSWPSAADRRVPPAGASLAGEHQISGASLPPDWRFRIPPAQDWMPALALQQTPQDGGVALQWNPVPTARAYFAAAMGAGPGRDETVVLWTSSELPETGMALFDYQAPGAIDGWLKDKVLLAPSQTQCSVPKGVFPGGADAGAMLRVIAYGPNLDLVHPPRPADPRQPWEPQWAVKLRVKSVATALLGAEAGAEPAVAAERPSTPTTPTTPGAPPPDNPADKVVPGVKDLLKGILGR